MPRGTKKFARMMEETLTEYPQETTIHGVKYLANRSSPIAHRIYWSITFIISVSLLGNFVYNIGQRWLKKEVMLIDESIPTKVYEIPFPAITICPQIKYTQDKFNFFNVTESGPEEEPTDFEKKLEVASELCTRFLKLVGEKYYGVTPKNELPHFDWMDTLQQISPSIDDAFESCQWMSWLSNHPFKYDNCENIFSMILTNEGICFTFNTIRDILRMDSLDADFQYHNITREHDGWDPDKGYTKAYPYPYKGFSKRDSSDENGLGIILKANWSDITDLCSIHGLYIKNVGYKIALHSPTEYPHTYANFIPLEYEKRYRIAPIPKTTRTAIDFLSVPPERRGCYFNEERKLKFYTFYNKHNCRLECFANHTKKMYTSQPVPIPLPRDSNVTMELNFRQLHWEEFEYHDSISSHIEEFGAPEVEDDFSFYHDCKCLPACNSLHYGFTVVEHNQPNDYYDGDVDKGIIRTEVYIILNEPNFIGQKRVRSYTFDIMLSDFGGLLGLFMGGSILSLFELFYFFIIRNCSKCNKSKVPADNVSPVVAQN